MKLFRARGPCSAESARGTGSWPQSPQGWQRQMRLNASQLPANAPCSRMAWMAYAEQLGVKRHWLNGPNKKVIAGESVQRYTRTTPIRIY